MTQENIMRPSWDQYFIDMMDTVATRATCNRGKSGCIIVKEKRIISTGYVGSPPGLDHCDEVGHLMKQVIDDDGTTRQHCMRTIHAEQNAICQAAKHGTSLADSTLYCKMEPCRVCAMLIISCGITKVVAKSMYHAAGETREMFEKAGIEMVVLEESVEEYTNQ